MLVVVEVSIVLVTLIVEVLVSVVLVVVLYVLVLISVVVSVEVSVKDSAVVVSNAVVSNLKLPRNKKIYFLLIFIFEFFVC